MTLNNLFGDIPASLPEELFSVLVEQEGLKIERIVSRGHCSPADEWYDQDNHEWVALLKGKAVIAYPDKPSVTLVPGDYLLLTAHERHRVDWTIPDEDTVWLAIHY
ncbi:hypothetical protein [Halioglobus sp. HI00S01]|uniref:hypothetical protein n=1 Tax=Halioglobus sp. HI00S01 TaxID=1822214 RepID=UPI0018D4630D|nr:hypothetical protein [Halioglobus sp. HI00S01]